MWWWIAVGLGRPRSSPRWVEGQPNHGDVLTLSTEAEALQTQGHNVNNGKWLLPCGNKMGGMVAVGGDVFMGQVHTSARMPQRPKR